MKIIIIFCFCGLVGCGVKPVSDAKINYGSSSIYSEEDMNAAIELIKEEFSTWEGCELHDIFYSSDDEVGILKLTTSSLSGWKLSN